LREGQADATAHVVFYDYPLTNSYAAGQKLVWVNGGDEWARQGGLAGTAEKDQKSL
jgi:hypothetical protein